MSVAHIILRTALVVVFFAALVGKLRGHGLGTFATSLSPFGITDTWQRRLAAMLVGCELVAALALVAVPRIGGWLAMAILVVFSSAILWTLHRGRVVRCHCFGSSRAILGRSHVARNLVLAGAAAAVTRPVATGWLAFPDVMLLVATGALAGWLVTRWDDLLFLLRPPTLASRGHSRSQS